MSSVIQAIFSQLLPATVPSNEQEPKMPVKFFPSDCLGYLSEQILANILCFCHFDEVSVILKLRPELASHIALTDLLMTMEQPSRSVVCNHLFSRKRRRDGVGTKIHMQSTPRFWRILAGSNKDTVCETCGRTSSENCRDRGHVSYRFWWGLWLCSNCEHQTHCEKGWCYLKCDRSVPVHFTRWNFLSTPKFDRFTGEPIGPIITEQHAKQIIVEGSTVSEFLAGLPPVLPTGGKLEELSRIALADAY